MASPLSDDERLARAAITYLARPGDPHIHAAIATHGAAATYRKLTAAQHRTSDWQTTTPARQAANLLSDRRTRVVIPGDNDWPGQLADLTHPDVATATGSHHAPPPALWLRGTANLHQALHRSVTITGALAATPYGAHIAADIAHRCAEAGYTIVAGGGYGIEAAAHRGALAANGTTIAVLPSGLDKPHPAGNNTLFDQIRLNGILISEAPPHTGATRPRYGTRGRLLAALTAGTVLVEASPRGGTAIAVLQTAAALGRTAMAVPGPVTSAPSAGCHHMLRDRRVQLVTGADDVLTAVTTP